MKAILSTIRLRIFFSFLGCFFCLFIFAILFISPVFADNDHLVAHWTFDETTDNANALDSVGSNDGIPTNDPIRSTDVPPVSFTDLRSASFSGTNYFTLNNPVSDDFSICAWIKTTSTGGGTHHWESAPIMDGEVGGVAYDFGFGVGNGGKLMFGNGGLISGSLVDSQVNGATTINDDTWHNVCATRNDTTGEVKLYVDAQLDGFGTTGTGSLTQNAHARIGYGYDGAALFNGFIDDVRVYDTVLTDDQLENITKGSNDPDSPPDDNDGVSAAIEDAGPNNGDANGDGTKDSSEAYVTSLQNPVVNNAYITVALDNNTCTSLNNVSVSSPTVTDTGYTYPTGLLNFDASCNAHGDSTTVTIYYDKLYNTSNWIARKYQNGTYKTISGAIFGTATVGGNTVSTLTYTLVDGGPLDADGVANGTIVDPVGAAVIASTNNSSQSSGSSISNSCNNSKPSGAPDLFQIDASTNQARLYFTPLISNVTDYYIAYGYSSGDERFGVMTGLGSSTGVLSYTINDLSSTMTYYFKVRPQNGCMPGDWSNEMKATTAKAAGGLTYYKNFLTRVFSVFPKQVSEIKSTNILGATTNNTQVKKSCIEYTVKPGDSLWNIAQKQLGTGFDYPKIEKKNSLNSTVLNTGQTLKVGC